MRPPHPNGLGRNAAVFGQQQQGGEPREEAIVVHRVRRPLRVKQSICGGGQAGLGGGVDRRCVHAEGRASQEVGSVFGVLVYHQGVLG